LGSPGGPAVAAEALAQLSARVVACHRCPRLVAWREEAARVKRAAFRDQEYWGRPVPGFGDPQAKLLILGLAPAAHGANRTGRMFTGDGPRGAGDFLMAALYRAGLANLPRSEHRNDGLALRGVYLSAVVRCAPPKNRPNRDEIENCLPFLVEELRVLRELKTVLALGRIAFSGYLAALEKMGVTLPRPRPRFSHGAVYRLGEEVPVLVASYHPSRQNTQTGRLTQDMFDTAVASACRLAGL